MQLASNDSGPVCMLIPPPVVEARWVERYQKLVEDALDYSDGAKTSWGLLNDVVLGDAWLLEVRSGRELQAVAVLEIAPCRGSRLLHVTTLTGDEMDFWIEIFISYLKEMAKGLDCIGVSCTGRMGWQRALKKHGFVPQHINMRLEEL